MSFLPTSGNIGFKVTGLSESIRGLDNIMRDWPVVRRATLYEAARFIVNEAKRDVHVVSGDLKRSIGIEPAISQNSVIVSAKMPYAWKENARPGTKKQTPKTKGPYGTHDYFTKAINNTTRDFQSKIKVNFDSLLRKNKTR